MAFTADEQAVIDNLDERITNIENLILNLQSDIQQLNNITTQSGMVSINSEMDQVSDKVDALNNQVTTLDTQTASNSTNISSLQNTVSAINSDTIVISNDISENSADIQTLQERMSLYESNFDKVVGKTPDPPYNLALSEIDDYVELTFNLPATLGVNEYEIWSSLGNADNYKLREIIPAEDIPQGTETLTVVDKSYSRVTTVYYKIYSVDDGNRSTALTGSIQLTNTVPDPASINVEPDLYSFNISYPVPDDRRLDSIEIYVDAKTDELSLNRTDATLIYKGLLNKTTYDIQTTDLEKTHQFWVESVTRT